MAAIGANEVYVWSSQEYGVLGVFNSYDEFINSAKRSVHKQYIPADELEVMVNLLNKGEYCFGNDKNLYKLEIQKM